MKSNYNQSYTHCKFLALVVLLMASLSASWASGGVTGGTPIRTIQGTDGRTNSSDPAYADLAMATIVELRAGFTEAVESMAATEQAIRSMDARFSGDRLLWPPLARAYRASLEGLIGKHSPNLLEKFNRVNAAIAGYDGLVEACPDSLELRFLRFTFYSQLPGLFGVGKHVVPDRAVLTDMLERGNDERVPESQKLEMIHWILKDGKPDKAETARLKAAASRFGHRP